MREQNLKGFNRLAVRYFASPSHGRAQLEIEGNGVGRRFGRFDVADRAMWQHRLERTLGLLIRYDQVSRVCDGTVDKIDWVADGAEKLRIKERNASVAR